MADGLLLKIQLFAKARELCGNSVLEIRCVLPVVSVHVERQAATLIWSALLFCPLQAPARGRVYCLRTFSREIHIPNSASAQVSSRQV